MEVVYEHMDRIILNNDDGKLFLNYPCAFEENTDEILVRTQIVNTKLKRGWIGDLTYETTPGVEVKDQTVSHGIEWNTFHDVLLANVRVWESDTEGCITWEYKFLKK